MLGMLQFLASCNPDTLKPATVYFDEDTCDHCQMLISEPGFAAQYFPAKGKVRKFDDVGCMLAELRKEEHPARAVFVASYQEGSWLEASQAVYLRSDQLHTPMSSGLAAFPNPEAAQKAREDLGGETATFAEIVTGVD